MNATPLTDAQLIASRKAADYAHGDDGGNKWLDVALDMRDHAEKLERNLIERERDYAH